MKVQLWLSMALAGLLSACASSPIKNVWVNPDAGKIEFKKTIVAAVGPSESVRRGAEEALVRDMYPLHGEAAYKFMDAEKLQDVEAAKKMVKERGYDGALVVKYLGRRQEVREVPSAAPYGGFYGYYRSPYPYAMSTSTVDVRDITSIEMTIFSLQEDKVLWSGNMELSSSNDVNSIVSRLSEAALNDLRSRGLLEGVPTK